MLEKETVLDLLGVVESGSVDVPTLPLLRSIVQFGVPPLVGAELGDRIAVLLDVPPGTPDRPEYLQTLSMLSTDDATERIRAVATDLSDPDSFTAARLLSGAGASEAVAAHLPHLARIAEQSGDTAALRALASLPLEEYAVPAGTFDASLRSPSIEARLWAAIAVAKLGDHAPLRRVHADLAEDAPDWMHGNPWTPYDMLSETRPLPEAVRAVLLDLDADHLERNQRILVWALTGTRTATGQEIAEVDRAPTLDRPFKPLKPVTPDEAARMLRAVEAAAESKDASRIRHVDVHRAPLLPREQQAELVTRLVETCLDQEGSWDSIAWGNATMDALGPTWHLELPVGRIVDAYVKHEAPGMSVQQLGAVLSRADDDGVVRVIAEGIRAEPTAAGRLACLLEEASRGTVVYLGAGGQSGWDARFTYPDLASPQEPGHSPTPDFGGTGQSAPPRSRGLRWPRLRWPGRRAGDPITIGGDPITIGGDQGGVLEVRDAPPPDRLVGAYSAYPCIATEDDVVLAHTPFTVTIGLSASSDPAVGIAGPIVITDRFPIEDLEMELVVDPTSIEVVAGVRVFPLRVTGMGDFPTHEVELRAVTRPGLDRERQIAVLYRRRGRVVGFAFRRIQVVSNQGEYRRAQGPSPILESILDLTPLVDDKPPDLLLCLFRGDAEDSYVWGVYPASGPSPDLTRSGTVLQGARDFATYTQRAVRSKDFRGPRIFDQLVGYGTLIDRAMPQVVTDVIRRVVAESADHAPSILLLTQESYVPWELAVPRPHLDTAYGGQSPFLGAHAAISRWPLSDRKEPELTRTAALAVSRQGAITADYTGVKGWPPLTHAQAEVADLVRDYGMARVGASRTELRACLTGETAYDLIHVALHGQADPQGLEDGLVLVESDPAGNPTPSFFNAAQVVGLQNRSSHPFVFLNACQVGGGESVLGTYAGFATSVLQTGASAVVAPLWNVDDEVAAVVSRRFYDAALATPPVPVAEVLREIRKDYTEASVNADPAAHTPTLIAYQCFGHPHFTLQRHLPEDPP